MCVLFVVLFLGLCLFSGYDTTTHKQTKIGKSKKGNFFHPKFGTVDYGLHALCFAVCKNRKDYVKKLLFEKGAKLLCFDEYNVR